MWFEGGEQDGSVVRVDMEVDVRFKMVDGARFEDVETVMSMLLAWCWLEATDVGLVLGWRRSAGLGARRRPELPENRWWCGARWLCSGIVTARVAGVDTGDVADALSRQGINVSTTVAEHNQFDSEAWELIRKRGGLC